MSQRNQGYGQGIRLGVLPGVPFHRLLEIHFLNVLLEKSTVIGPPGVDPEGSSAVLQELHSNSTLGFASFPLGEINFQLQIQNRAARRINFHSRDRSVGMSAENALISDRFSLDF